MFIMVISENKLTISSFKITPCFPEPWTVSKSILASLAIFLAAGDSVGFIFLDELITTKVLISLIAVCIGIYFVRQGDNKLLKLR